MILTKPQARAVYLAMRELNEIGARIEVRHLQLDNLTLSVRQTENTITISDRHQTYERFKTQADFAKAYGVPI